MAIILICTYNNFKNLKEYCTKSTLSYHKFNLTWNSPLQRTVTLITLSISPPELPTTPTLIINLNRLDFKLPYNKIYPVINSDVKISFTVHEIGMRHTKFEFGFKIRSFITKYTIASLSYVHVPTARASITDKSGTRPCIGRLRHTVSNILLRSESFMPGSVTTLRRPCKKTWALIDI